MTLLDFVALWFLLSAHSTPSGFVPEPDPGPNPRCPSDTRLVVGHHFDEVEHLCTDWHSGPKRCFAYYPFLTVGQSPREEVATCMDRFEAPNEEGKRPIVMKTFSEAEAFCASHEKHVCSETEWETACESGDEKPWFYGWKHDGSVCNTQKPWKPFDAAALGAGGAIADREVEHLWQGTVSGEMSACRTKDGIYDMMGNVEEWVESSRPRRYKGALMGGFWAKPWVGCRGTNDAHEPNFRFYEVGFRCCVAPKPEAASAVDGGAP